MRKPFFIKIIILSFFANITFLSCTPDASKINTFFLKHFKKNRTQLLLLSSISIIAFISYHINSTSQESSLRILIHESSHAVAHYILYGKAPLSINVSEKGHYKTATLNHPAISHFLDSSVDDVMKCICQSIMAKMAGVAGEAVFMKNDCDTWEKAKYNENAANDVLDILKLRIILEAHMQDKKNELTKLGYLENSRLDLSLLYKKTKELLKENEVLIVGLVNALKTKNVLFEKEIIELFNKIVSLQTNAEKFNGSVSDKIVPYKKDNFINSQKINEFQTLQNKEEKKEFTSDEIKNMRNEKFFDKNFFYSS